MYPFNLILFTIRILLRYYLYQLLISIIVFRSEQHIMIITRMLKICQTFKGGTHHNIY